MGSILKEIIEALREEREEHFYINEQGLADLYDEAFQLAPSRQVYDDLRAFVGGVILSYPQHAGGSPALGFRGAQKRALLEHLEALLKQE